MRNWWILLAGSHILRVVYHQGMMMRMTVHMVKLPPRVSSRRMRRLHSIVLKLGWPLVRLVRGDSTSLTATLGMVILPLNWLASSWDFLFFFPQSLQILSLNHHRFFFLKFYVPLGMLIGYGIYDCTVELLKLYYKRPILTPSFSPLKAWGLLKAPRSRIARWYLLMTSRRVSFSLCFILINFIISSF